eukprot:tig00021035_g17263.t1
MRAPRKAGERRAAGSFRRPTPHDLSLAPRAEAPPPGEPKNPAPARPRSPPAVPFANKRPEDDLRYLNGNFQPVDKEILVEGLETIGTIPEDLNGANLNLNSNSIPWLVRDLIALRARAGVFIRNGSNPRFSPTLPYHWIDGDGMLHATALIGGKAGYANRWIRTNAFNLETAAGSPVPRRPLFQSVLMSPPGIRCMQRLFGNLFRSGGEAYKGAANTSIVGFGGRLLALAEDGPPVEIDPHDLSTRGRFTFDGRWDGPFTAHPKIDPATGEMVVFGPRAHPSPAPISDLKAVPFSPAIRYGVFSKTGRLTNSLTLRFGSTRCPLMHDFAVTPRYSILYDSVRPAPRPSPRPVPPGFKLVPFNIRTTRILSNSHPVGCERGHPLRFWVVPRHATSASQSAMHTANAYEDGRTIVVIANRPARPPLPSARPRLSIDHI